MKMGPLWDIVMTVISVITTIFGIWGIFLSVDKAVSKLKKIDRLTCYNWSPSLGDIRKKNQLQSIGRVEKVVPSEDPTEPGVWNWHVNRFRNETLIIKCRDNLEQLKDSACYLGKTYLVNKNFFAFITERKIRNESKFQKVYPKKRYWKYLWMKKIEDKSVEPQIIDWEYWLTRRAPKEKTRILVSPEKIPEIVMDINNYMDIKKRLLSKRDKIERIFDEIEKQERKMEKEFEKEIEFEQEKEEEKITKKLEQIESRKNQKDKLKLEQIQEKISEELTAWFNKKQEKYSKEVKQNKQKKWESLELLEIEEVVFNNEFKISGFEPTKIHDMSDIISDMDKIGNFTYDLEDKNSILRIVNKKLTDQLDDLEREKELATLEKAKTRVELGKWVQGEIEQQDLSIRSILKTVFSDGVIQSGLEKAMEKYTIEMQKGQSENEMKELREDIKLILNWINTKNKEEMEYRSGMMEYEPT